MSSSEERWNLFMRRVDGAKTYASAIGILAQNPNLQRLSCVTLHDVDTFPPEVDIFIHLLKQMKRQLRLRLEVEGCPEARRRLLSFWEADVETDLDGRTLCGCGQYTEGDVGDLDRSMGEDEDRPELSSLKTEPWGRVISKEVDLRLTGAISNASSEIPPQTQAQAPGRPVYVQQQQGPGGGSVALVAVLANNQEQVRSLERVLLGLNAERRPNLKARVCILSLSHNSSGLPDVPSSFLEKENLEGRVVVLVGVPSDFLKLGGVGLRGADVWDGGEMHYPGFSQIEMLGCTVVRRLLKREWEDRRRLCEPLDEDLRKFVQQAANLSAPVSTWKLLFQERRGRYRLCPDRRTEVERLDLISSEDDQAFLQELSKLEVLSSFPHTALLQIHGQPSLLNSDLRDWRLIFLQKRRDACLFPPQTVALAVQSESVSARSSETSRPPSSPVMDLRMFPESRGVLKLVDAHLEELGLVWRQQQEGRERLCLTDKGLFCHYMLNRMTVERAAFLFDCALVSFRKEGEVFGGGMGEWGRVFWGMVVAEECRRGPPLFGGEAIGECPLLLSLQQGFVVETLTDGEKMNTKRQKEANNAKHGVAFDCRATNPVPPKNRSHTQPAQNGFDFRATNPEPSHNGTSQTQPAQSGFDFRVTNPEPAHNGTSQTQPTQNGFDFRATNPKPTHSRTHTQPAQNGFDFRATNPEPSHNGTSQTQPAQNGFDFRVTNPEPAHQRIPHTQPAQNGFDFRATKPEPEHLNNRKFDAHANPNHPDDRNGSSSEHHVTDCDGPVPVSHRESGTGVAKPVGRGEVSPTVSGPSTERHPDPPQAKLVERERQERRRFRISDLEAAGAAMEECMTTIVHTSASMRSPRDALYQARLLSRVFLEPGGDSGVLMGWEGVQHRYEHGCRVWEDTSRCLDKIRETCGTDVHHLTEIILRNFPHRVLQPRRGHERVPVSAATFAVAKGDTPVTVVRESGLKVHGRAFGRAADVLAVALSLHHHQKNNEAKGSFVFAVPLCDAIAQADSATDTAAGSSGRDDADTDSNSSPPRDTDSNSPPPRDTDRPCRGGLRSSRPPPDSPPAACQCHWMEDLRSAPGVELLLYSPHEEDVPLLEHLQTFLRESEVCRVDSVLTNEEENKSASLSVSVPALRFLDRLKMPSQHPLVQHICGGTWESHDCSSSVSLRCLLESSCRRGRGVLLTEVNYPTISLSRDGLGGVEALLKAAGGVERDMGRRLAVHSCALTAAIYERLLKPTGGEWVGHESEVGVGGSAWGLGTERGAAGRKEGKRLLAELRGNEMEETKRRLFQNPPICGSEKLRFLSRVDGPEVEQLPFERQATRETARGPSKVRDQYAVERQASSGMNGGRGLTLGECWGLSLEDLGLSVKVVSKNGTRRVCVQRAGRGESAQSPAVTLEVEVFLCCPLLRRDREALSKAYMEGEVNRVNGQVFVDQETHTVALVRQVQVEGGGGETELWGETVENLRGVLRSGSNEERREGGGYGCCGTRKCRSMRLYFHPSLETFILRQRNGQQEKEKETPPCWICGGRGEKF
uniref:Uncharacterized protein n=1 Tax=Chromera velia CCMP2878 TaxID=1169474 RepID=A0A0G4I653_9ALVE|eukprot:Cvel_11315.t1-p1 / transcript=Cvel_11315.t1 / gene=Cvel_11315 / organism=Chromera_velia_CCMP2878 / gene_product=hypothetical protein / transcript_product=hypothetical protein / location=Cvel_scaffold707:52522-60807(+) / protein_length=1541 / sequence_SO=supercontig / SO=protein_coding / is_pseudo=false